MPSKSSRWRRSLRPLFGARPDALVVRFQAPGLAALDALAEGVLPEPLLGGEAEGESFRDVYYDTEECELGLRGALVRLRLHASGEQTLAVEVMDPRDGPPRRAEVTVAAGDPRELFAGLSEPAQLVRSMIDPARLVSWMEVETRRRVRAATLAVDGRSVGMWIECAARTLREGDLSAERLEVESRLDDDDETSRASLRALEAEHGLRLMTGDPLDHWRDALKEAEADWLA